MRDSSSTDCISLEDSSSSYDYYLTTTESESNLKNFATKLHSTRKSSKLCSIPDKVATKIKSEKGKSINTKNSQCSLTSNKMIKNKPRIAPEYNINKFRPYDKVNIISFDFTNKNVLKNGNQMLNASSNNNNNEFIRKQNLRNELQENIIGLVRENSKKSQLIDNVKNSISSSYNENKKISLMHQRYIIQSNSINNEIKALKEELIKMNKQLLKELNEYLINKELIEKEEEKVLEVKNENANTKAFIDEIEIEKRAIKEEIFFYKKEIDKYKLWKI